MELTIEYTTKITSAEDLEDIDEESRLMEITYQVEKFDTPFGRVAQVVPEETAKVREYRAGEWKDVAEWRALFGAGWFALENACIRKWNKERLVTRRAS